MAKAAAVAAAAVPAAAAVAMVVIVFVLAGVGFHCESWFTLASHLYSGEVYISMRSLFVLW